MMLQGNCQQQQQQKPSSLFRFKFSDEEKKFYNLGTRRAPQAVQNEDSTHLNISEAEVRVEDHWKIKGFDS
jgi:hypothetical protein